MICPSGLVPGKGSYHCIHPLDATFSIGEGPALSRKDEAGKMTSACLVVSVAEDLLDHQQVEVVERLHHRWVFGSVCTTSSPISHKTFRLPFSASSHISEFSIPYLSARATNAVRISCSSPGRRNSYPAAPGEADIPYRLLLHRCSDREAVHTPRRPIFPVIMAGSAMSMTVKVPCRCSVTPNPWKLMALPAVAGMCCFANEISSTPVIDSSSSMFRSQDLCTHLVISFCSRFNEFLVFQSIADDVVQHHIQHATFVPGRSG